MIEDNPAIQNVIAALNELYNNDAELLENEVHEGALNGRLANYLREIFEMDSISVDQEYNRHRDQLKNYGIDRKNAVVDIVIHERMTDDNNLIAFECKRKEVGGRDIEKLEALIGPEFNYQYGILVLYYPKVITIYRIEDAKVKTKELSI